MFRDEGIVLILKKNIDGVDGVDDNGDKEGGKFNGHREEGAVCCLP